MELTVAGEIGRTLHNKKRHRCFVLGRLKPEKFQIVVLEQKAEVKAYGYGTIISRGVCREDYPHARFWGISVTI